MEAAEDNQGGVDGGSKVAVGTADGDGNAVRRGSKDVVDASGGVALGPSGEVEEVVATVALEQSKRLVPPEGITLSVLAAFASGLEVYVLPPVIRLPSEVGPVSLVAEIQKIHPAGRTAQFL